MVRRNAAPWIALLVLGFAGCSGSQDPAGPEGQSAVPDIEINQRPVELVNFDEIGQSQRFVFPSPVSRPRFGDIEMLKGAPSVYTGATVESRGSLAPPVVDGRAVHLTDVRIFEIDDRLVALAVSNTAGLEVRGALQILDLSEPFAPQMPAEVLVADAEYAAVTIDENAAYALGNDANGALIDIYDIADMASPELRLRMFLPGRVALAGVVDEDRLYVVTGAEGGVHELDIDNRFAPVLLETIEVLDARDLTRYQNRTFVLHGAGVSVLTGNSRTDLAIPGLPAQAPTRARWARGEWIVSTDEGLVSVDAQLRRARSIYSSNEGTANGIDTDGGALIFRANGEAGLELLHRADDDRVSALGFLDLANAGSSNSVTAQDNFLLSGDGRGGVLLAAFNYDILEDFEGTAIQPYPWVEVAGDWILAEKDGSMCYTAPLDGNPRDRRAFWGTDARWSDFQLDARVWLDEGKGGGIYFRATDVYNRDRQEAYVFQYDPGYGEGAFLYRRIRNGRETEPFAVTYKSDVPELAGEGWYEVWRDIRVRAEGTRLRAWVDGVLVLDVEDDVLEYGTIGLRAWDTSQPWFDDLRITELD